MIIVTRSFSKELSDFDISIGGELVSLISKYDRGLSKNLLPLKKEGDLIILKGYLNGKRIRVTIAKTTKSNYIPLEILKKESRDGYNIRGTYNASNIVDRINREIEMGQYEVWEMEK
ncbi:MAG: hypothetical protein Q8K26_00025 [Candidatus Gracilibacteria bacterium]|nr:hypothetical protein [Candidatus Gracilibacteria bacterium]